MSAGDNIGMMEGAFFVSKGVILEWMNELLDLQVTKIEQCATAAVYCQVMDCIYPGTFNLAKVKWGAKFDYEYIENYKVLQQAFQKNGVKRHIDVDKLVKARYQDNLEFCQWIKRYFDLNYSGEPYNATERRKGQQLFYIMGGNKVAQLAKKGGQVQPEAKSGGGAKVYQPKEPQGNGMGGGGMGGPKKFQSSMGVGGGAQVQELEGQVQELKLNNDTLDREREFYFGKLRDIEEMLQKRGLDQDPLGSEVLKILYASEEELVTVDEQGMLTITPVGESGDQGME